MTTERTLAQELEIIRRHLIGMWTINDTKAAAVHIENAINQLHSKSAAIESLRAAVSDIALHQESQRALWLQHYDADTEITSTANDVSAVHEDVARWLRLALDGQPIPDAIKVNTAKVREILDLADARAALAAPAGDGADGDGERGAGR